MLRRPRVLKDLAHFFRGPCRVLGYVPIVGALVPDQRSLLKLANEESEDEEDEEESKEEEEEEEEEEVPEDPFDDLKTDSEDFKRSVSDPSMVVLEALQDIGAAQRRNSLICCAWRRLASGRGMEVDRVRTASRGSRGSMSQPPGRESRVAQFKAASTSRSASRSIARAQPTPRPRETLNARRWRVRR